MAKTMAKTTKNEGNDVPLVSRHGINTEATKPGYATFSTQDFDASPPQVDSYATASWFSRLLFAYAQPVLATGNARQLETTDLWQLDSELCSSVASTAFKRAFIGSDQSVPTAILACYGSSFFLVGLGSLAMAACGVFAPVVLHHVIDAFASPQLDVSSLTLWVLAFFASRLVNAFAEAHVNFHLEVALLQLTVSLKALLFEKAMRINGTATADVTNLFTADMDSLLWAGYQVNVLWIAPLQIAVVLYLLYDVLALAAFAGLAVIFVSMYANYLVARGSMAAFNGVMTRKDTRMQTIKEVFHAIQVIKLNAWESKFLQRIRDGREKELHALTRYLYLMALSTCLVWAAPLCVSVVSFATYTLVLEKELTAAKVFTAMVLFAAIRDPLSQFPDAVQNAVQATLAIKRIATYLAADEIDMNHISRDGTEYEADVMIAVDKATFTWQPMVKGDSAEAGDAVLRDVSFRVRKGDLVVVHGAVGAGKSSLCAAMLGELSTQQGRVFVRSPKVAYTSQQPWIQHMSIRDNILFGLPFDQRKYDRVVDACGLVMDIAMFPAGDATEIGQKGVNLSGGQKARVSLARACYADADIYVLDAPFAAVDAVVQAEIFSKCVCGLLESKTIVLVTHHHSVITSPAVNVSILVEESTVKVNYTRSTEPRSAYATQDKTVKEAKASGEDGGKKLTEEAFNDGVLVEEEGRQDGRVSSQVFAMYFTALGGMKSLVGFVLVLVVWQSFQSGSDIWLSHWTGSKPGTEGSTGTARDNLVIYALLSVGAGVFVFLRAVAIAYTGVRASRQLFDAMTTSLLLAPLRFFDANPIGRLLNRYAEDMSIIDFHLHFCFYTVLGATAVTVFRLLTAVYVIKWAGLLLLPLAVVYVRLAFYYLATSREVTRLMKVSTSPVLSHLSASEQGVTVLRAFGPQYVDRAIAENGRRCDATNRVWFAQTVVNQWFTVRVHLVGFAVVVLVVSTVLLLHNHLSPGLVGLAFMYAVSIDTGLSSWVRAWSWMEIAMVSPERISEYVDIPAEGKSMPVTTAGLEDWPSSGTVAFDSVTFAYKPDGDLVLKGVSFAIHHREKIGIVGRTGAGKSSLTMALFRINELTSGRITIDGVDISTLELHTLRSRLSIIPQAPVLFKGPLRSYMDPFDEYDDAAIWRAVEKIGMKMAVSALDGKLQYELSENGDNFSVGERQLLCLACALLRKSRVVVLDEATASIDDKTEQQLQTMIQREFEDATVLTIAHRLATVVESDRVLVLSDGRVVEFDTPRDLAKRKGGVFRELAQESGCLQQLL